MNIGLSNRAAIAMDGPKMIADSAEMKSAMARIVARRRAPDLAANNAGLPHQAGAENAQCRRDQSGLCDREFRFFAAARMTQRDKP